jgi:hypothetical protein
MQKFASCKSCLDHETLLWLGILKRIYQPSKKVFIKSLYPYLSKCTEALKLTRKKFSTRWLKNIDTLFWLLKFLISNRHSFLFPSALNFINIVFSLILYVSLLGQDCKRDGGSKGRYRSSGEGWGLKLRRWLSLFISVYLLCYLRLSPMLSPFIPIYPSFDPLFEHILLRGR